MLRLLLAKDLRRVLRNPWPWVLNLSLPLAITALFGLVFGGGGKDASIARIKVAVVDEDQSVLGSLFKSALSQGEAAKRFDVIHPSREGALQLIRDNKLSAVFVVPANFTEHFLSGDKPIELEVIKNPAERFYPAIVEELAAVAVTGLNAIHRNFNSEFPKIRAALTNEFDFHAIGEIATHLGNRIKSGRDYLDPPLVQYSKAQIAEEKKDESPGISVFAYILAGMSSAFLLFLADHSMRDVYTEMRLRTMDRLRSIQHSFGTFIAGKVIFAAVSVIIGSGILFGAGALVFQITWRSPGMLALACLGYSFFAGGFMALLVSVIRTERQAETINNMILFTVAIAGGSYFPADQMPAFMREHICPLFPNYWFIEAVRALQKGSGFQGPLLTVLGLAVAGIIMAALAGFMLQRRLTAGARA
jgi:ABC-type multidrug transport system permease subunit